ncbi:MAG: SRPBCC family protein [Aeropyrum sp.]|nr:SRPBCC family protein [Aeropyrum sp.]MCE4615709.1 SRPBCC family protein [Aeropyrum sp.]
MELNYSGSFTVSKSVEEVFDFLSDPDKFARSFPGFKSVERENGRFTINLRLSLGPIRGDASVRAEFEELDRPKYARVRGSGRGAGSTLDFTLEFTVKAENGSTKVEWAFSGSVGGLAASMGGRVLNSLANRMINDIISGIKRELESS